jgi:hypothetical protein
MDWQELAMVGFPVVGVLMFWLGYHKGYGEGARTGAIVASIDPQAPAWWK